MSPAEKPDRTGIARRAFLGTCLGGTLFGVAARPADAKPVDDAVSVRRFTTTNSLSTCSSNEECTPVLQELQKILPDEVGISDALGRGVAIEGETAMVGAPLFDGDPNEARGVVYVLQRRNGQWRLCQRLTADYGPINPNSGPGSFFGSCIALDGDTALIYGSNQVAFIFERRDGKWVQTDRLEIDGPAPGFALRDDIVALGIDSPREEPGVVNIYERRKDDNDDQLDDTCLVDDGHRKSQWVLRQRLTVDIPTFDEFGFNVAIGHGVILVAARKDEPTGSVYVFTHDGTEWVEHQKLTPTGATPGSFFGDDIAIDGKTAIIGAPLDSEAARSSGAVYIFEWNGSEFVQRQKLTPSANAETAVLGGSVDIDGCLAVAGSWRDSTVADDAGAVYVFNRQGETWSEYKKLTASDAREGDALAQGSCSLAVDDGTVLAGAEYHDKGQEGNVGAVYVFGDPEC